MQALSLVCGAMSRLVPLTALAVCLLTGCPKDEGTTVPGTGEQAVDAGPDLARLEKLGQAVGNCTMKTGNEYGIDPKCGDLKVYEDVRKALPAADQKKVDAALGPKFLGNKMGPVRALGATYLSLISGADVASSDMIADAMAKESEIPVLAHMVRSAGPAAERSPKVAAAIIAAAGHADKSVRFHATTILANPKIPGATAKILELAEKDPDREVRNLACSNLGQHGEEALALLEKVTADTTSPSYGACFVGLVRQWASPPHFDTESEKAYKLTIQRIAAKPHNEQSPGYTGLTLIAQLADEAGEAAEWRKKHAWFKQGPLVKALGEALVDPNTGYAARSGALDAAVKLGATKADLEAWRKTFGDKPPEGFATFVAKLDEEIKKKK